MEGSDPSRSTTGIPQGRNTQPDNDSDAQETPGYEMYTARESPGKLSDSGTDESIPFEPEPSGVIMSGEQDSHLETPVVISPLHVDDDNGINDNKNTQTHRNDEAVTHLSNQDLEKNGSLSNLSSSISLGSESQSLDSMHSQPEPAADSNVKTASTGDNSSSNVGLISPIRVSCKVHNGYCRYERGPEGCSCTVVETGETTEFKKGCSTFEAALKAKEETGKNIHLEQANASEQNTAANKEIHVETKELSMEAMPMSCPVTSNSLKQQSPSAHAQQCNSQVRRPFSMMRARQISNEALQYQSFFPPLTSSESVGSSTQPLTSSIYSSEGQVSKVVTSSESTHQATRIETKTIPQNENEQVQRKTEKDGIGLQEDQDKWLDMFQMMDKQHQEQLELQNQQYQKNIQLLQSQIERQLHEQQTLIEQRLGTLTPTKSGIQTSLGNLEQKVSVTNNSQSAGDRNEPQELNISATSDMSKTRSEFEGDMNLRFGFADSIKLLRQDAESTPIKSGNVLSDLDSIEGNRSLASGDLKLKGEHVQKEKIERHMSPAGDGPVIASNSEAYDSVSIQRNYEETRNREIHDKHTGLEGTRNNRYDMETPVMKALRLSGKDTKSEFSSERVPAQGKGAKSSMSLSLTRDDVAKVIQSVDDYLYSSNKSRNDRLSLEADCDRNLHRERMQRYSPNKSGGDNKHAVDTEKQAGTQYKMQLPTVERNVIKESRLGTVQSRTEELITSPEIKNASRNNLVDSRQTVHQTETTPDLFHHATVKDGEQPSPGTPDSQYSNFTYWKMDEKHLYKQLPERTPDVRSHSANLQDSAAGYFPPLLSEREVDITNTIQVGLDHHPPDNTAETPDQVDSANSSLMDETALTTSQYRLNLREKHSKHMADLRAYYELEIEDLKGKLDSSEYIKSKSPYKNIEREKKRYEDRCKLLEQELLRAKQYIGEIEGQMQSLEIQVGNYPKRLNVALEKASSLQIQLEDLRTYAKEKDTQLLKVETKNRELKASLEETYKYQDLKATVSTKDASLLRKVQKEHDALIRQHEQTTTTLSTTETQLYEAKMELAQFKKLIADLQLERQRLGRENDLMRQKGLTSSISLGELQSQLQSTAGKSEAQLAYSSSAHIPKRLQQEEKKKQLQMFTHQRNQTKPKNFNSNNTDTQSDTDSEGRPLSPLLKAERQLERRKRTESCKLLNSSLHSEYRSTYSPSNTTGSRPVGFFPFGGEIKTNTPKSKATKTETNTAKNRQGGSSLQQSSVGQNSEQYIPTKLKQEKNTTRNVPTTGHYEGPQDGTKKMSPKKPENTITRFDVPIDELTRHTGVSSVNTSYVTTSPKKTGDVGAAINGALSGKYSARPEWEAKTITNPRKDRKSRSKRTETKLVPSPADKSNEQEQKMCMIRDFQKRLDELLMEKRTAESDLSRIHTGATSKRNDRRRQEKLEEHLDTIDKDLGSIRMTLKRYHAL